MRRLRVNRKPLRNCASLAQPPRPRNRVYSLPGHLFALATLPHFRRVPPANRTVLLCLTAVTEFWLSLHTPSNTWRRSFGAWQLILALICMWHIAVFAARKLGTIPSLEPLFSGMFRCLKATHGLTFPIAARARNPSLGCAIQNSQNSFERVISTQCFVLLGMFARHFGLRGVQRRLPTQLFFLARTQPR